MQLVIQDILTGHTEVREGTLLGPVFPDMVHHGTLRCNHHAIRGYLAACLALGAKAPERSPSQFMFLSPYCNICQVELVMRLTENHVIMEKLKTQCPTFLSFSTESKGGKYDGGAGGSPEGG